jgi:hypothetical protein
MAGSEIEVATPHTAVHSGEHFDHLLILQLIRPWVVLRDQKLERRFELRALPSLLYTRLADGRGVNDRWGGTCGEFQIGRESGERQKGCTGQVVIAMQTENDGVMNGCAL